MRSPLLMGRANSALIVIDVQEKLVPAISEGPKLVWNIERLVKAAKILDVQVRLTEQYPQGLGPTVEPLKELLGEAAEKSMISCRECESMFEELRSAGITNLALAGIESHVCVMQTALDCITAGFNVFLVVDASGSRFESDHKIALRRMESSGCFLTTAEATMFEWCESSKSPEFKSISQLVREPFGETSA